MSGVGEDAASVAINGLVSGVEGIGNLLLKIIEMRMRLKQERDMSADKSTVLKSGKISVDELVKGAQMQGKEVVRIDNFPTERLEDLEEACREFGIPMASVSLDGDNNCTVMCLASDRADFEKLMAQVIGKKIQEDPGFYAVKKNAVDENTLFATEQMLNRADIDATTFRTEDGGFITLVPKTFEKDFDIVVAKAAKASERVNAISAAKLEGSYADFEKQLDNTYVKLDTAEAYGVQFQLGEIAEKGGNTQGIKVVQSGEDFYAVVPKGGESKLSELRESFKEAKVQTDGIRVDYSDGAVTLGKEKGIPTRIPVTDSKTFINNVTEANFALNSPLAKHILCRDVAQRLPENERVFFNFDLTKNGIPHDNIPNIDILRQMTADSKKISQPQNIKDSAVIMYDQKLNEFVAVNEKDFVDDTLSQFSGLDRSYINLAAEKIRSDLGIERVYDNTTIPMEKLDTKNPLLSGVEYVDTPKGVFIANKSENSIGFCELPDGITRDKAAEVITARLGIENPAAVKECLDKLDGAVKFVPEKSGLSKIMEHGKEAFAKAQAAKASAKTAQDLGKDASNIGGAEGIAR